MRISSQGENALRTSPPAAAPAFQVASGGRGKARSLNGFLAYCMDAFERVHPWLITDVPQPEHDLEEDGKSDPPAAPHPPQHERQLPRHEVRVFAQEGLDVADPASLEGNQC